MMEVIEPAVISERKIGDGQPCFITLEAGPTHDGLASAKKLVEVAAECGADAVKFQIFDPDRLVADKTLPFSYDVLIDRESGTTETVTEPLYDILSRRALPETEWWQLKDYCDELGLLFFATVSDDSYFSMIEKMQLPSLKVASADVNHTPFLRQLARTGACIQLDTGNATLGEIETAIDVLRGEGNHNVIVHNCPSGYPARLDSINLKLLRTIKQVFQCPAAYSDHTPGWEMDIAALAMGADLLEKTITLDRMTRSVEHTMSLEPQEIRQFIQTIRDVETAMGQPRRIMTAAELEKRQAIRRSVYLLDPINAGQPLSQARVEFRRPGFGLSPQEYERFHQATIKQDLPAGTQLNLSHLNLA
jgi:sialic acid synthase SpsE